MVVQSSSDTGLVDSTAKVLTDGLEGVAEAVEIIKQPRAVLTAAVLPPRPSRPPPDTPATLPDTVTSSTSDTLKAVAAAFRENVGNEGRITETVFKKYEIASLIKGFGDCHSFTVENAPSPNEWEMAKEIEARIWKPFNELFAPSLQPLPENREAYSTFCTNRRKSLLGVWSQLLDGLQKNMQGMKEEITANETKMSLFLDMVGRVAQEIQRQQSINDTDVKDHERAISAMTARYEEKKRQFETIELAEQEKLMDARKDEEMNLNRIKTDKGSFANLCIEILKYANEVKCYRNMQDHAEQTILDTKEKAREAHEQHTEEIAERREKIAELLRVKIILDTMAAGSASLLSSFAQAVRQKCEQLKAMLDEYADGYNRIYMDYRTQIDHQVKAGKKLAKTTHKQIIDLRASSNKNVEHIANFGDPTGNLTRQLQDNDEKETHLGRLLTTIESESNENASSLEAMETNRRDLFAMLGIALPPITQGNTMKMTVTNESESVGIAHASPPQPEDDDQSNFINDASQNFTEGTLSGRSSVSSADD